MLAPKPNLETSMDMKTAPLSLLNDPTLLKTDSLINGQWVAGTSRFDVNDPATGKKLADVANLGPADAIAKGGKVVVGGKKLNGQFFEPTVISGATADMLCAKEETFGPFAPVFRFHKDQEAIDAANNTEFGLASYFYSRDVGRIFRVSEALEYGMVGINVGVIATEHVPFGGVKQSGLGREGSSHGMDEYLEMKYLCIGDITK
jgi:succinate-semialdehyde dehydrogenase/glutarate-semialdehyde dehydrogenase